MTASLALALSPHLDDAVFSAGGTLSRLAASGWRVIVATMFTRSVPDPSGFALDCQLDKGLAPDIDYMALRRDEDAAACALIGVEPCWIDLLEAPHRGYGSAAALFATVRDDDPARLAADEALRALLRSHDPALVLAPQAVGAHVDHRVLVDALRAIVPRAPCLWWQDFPYVAREPKPSAPFADHFAALEEIDVVTDPDRKARACEAYASQLGFQFGGAIGLRARLAAAGGVERFAFEPGSDAYPPARLREVLGR